MNPSPKKISPHLYFWYVIAAIFLGCVLFFYETRVNNVPTLRVTQNQPFSTTTFSQNQAVQPLSLIFATTTAEQELGLGNRASLPADEGMLFVFPMPGNYAFWMKDMSFSIDMIWMDPNFVITHIAADISPETYPATFSPNAQSSYVLETNAGYAEKNNLSVGETLDFVKNSLQNSQ